MRQDIREISEQLRNELETDIRVTLGDAIREPLFARLGNPRLFSQGDDNPVDCKLADFDQVGLVWCFFEQENGEPSAPFPVLNVGKNKIGDDEKVYKTPVHIVRKGNEYWMDGLAGYDAEEWFYNVNIRPQRSIKLSQFDVGLLRPTSPPSGKLLMSPATFHIDDVAYPVGALTTSDLISAYSVATGNAEIIKVEIDPTTGTFHYSSGAEYAYSVNADSPSHIDKVADAEYPKTTDSGRFHLGWVRIHDGITEILQSAIYYSQQLFSKNIIVAEIERGLIVTYEGNVVTDGGNVVRYNPTTETLFTLSEA